MTLRLSRVAESNGGKLTAPDKEEMNKIQSHLGSQITTCLRKDRHSCLVLVVMAFVFRCCIHFCIVLFV